LAQNNAATAALVVVIVLVLVLVLLVSFFFAFVFVSRLLLIDCFFFATWVFSPKNFQLRRKIRDCFCWYW